MKRNSHNIFSKISPGWDFDLHIHSNWSVDNLDGPNIRDYIPLSEKYKIHIGIADHFEFAYFNPEHPFYKDNRLNLDTIDEYLNEIDLLKENYGHITSGLEISYYNYMIDEITEFIDNYGNQFDHLIGSVHEIKPQEEITIKNQFYALIEKYGSFEKLLDEYFDLQKEMIKTRLFDSIAHPDVIFRFLDGNESFFKKSYIFDKRLMEIGHLCKSTNTLFEINISSLRYPWNYSLASKELLPHLIAHEIPLSIGSDSHILDHFENAILDLRKTNNLIQNDHFLVKKMFINSK